MKELSEIELPKVFKGFLDNYEQGLVPDSVVKVEFEKWLARHTEAPTSVRARIHRMISFIRKEIDARESCKEDTGIAAVPTLKELKKLRKIR